MEFAVSASPEDTAFFLGTIKSYKHFQNVYIMIRDDLYKRSRPEKFLERFLKSEDFRRKKLEKENDESQEKAEKSKKPFSPEMFEPRAVPNLDYSAESKKKAKEILYLISSPEVVRALFQKRNETSAKKRENTRLSNIRIKSEDEYQKEIARKSKKKYTAAEKADLLLKELSGSSVFFDDLIKIGESLKSHVIFNLVKTISVAYKSSFSKFNKTGIFNPPKTMPLDETFSFFLDLSEESLGKPQDDGMLVNIAKKGKKIFFPTAILKYLHGSKVFSMKLGFRHGILVCYFPYDIEIPLKKAFKKPKYAGMDLGIRNLISVFVDDQSSPSFCLNNNKVLARLARYGEKRSEIYEKYIDLAKETKKLRKDSSEKDGKRYRTDEEMKDKDADYKKLAGERDALRRRLDKMDLDKRNYISDILHKVARRTLEELELRNVSDLFTSRNLGKLKQEGANIGRNNNRKFHQIPLMKLVDYMKIYSPEYGITVHDEIDEAYTSKISALKGKLVLEAQTERNLKLEQMKTEKQNSAHSESNTESKPSRGTIPTFGRRDGRRFIEQNSKRYWHADVNGAANHIVVGTGREILFNKKKIAKLSNPAVVDIHRLRWINHGVVSRTPRVLTESDLIRRRYDSEASRASPNESSTPN